ncbi:MAG: hypothetical protein AMXMBFR7_26550 [Planctomycetota bacterium]
MPDKYDRTRALVLLGVAALCFAAGWFLKAARDPEIIYAPEWIYAERIQADDGTIRTLRAEAGYFELPATPGPDDC